MSGKWWLEPHPDLMERDMGETHYAWFDAVGFEERYQITRCGLVRSKPRYVNSPICGGERRIKGKIMKPAFVKKGYLAVQPIIANKKVSLYLHRMLAQRFIPNPENKPCVNHVDGNPGNNALDNLEWCTHHENMRHAFSTGLAVAPANGPGEASPSAKLTDEKVIDIKRRLNSGESKAAIARNHGVSRGTIGFIASGATWSHIAP